VEIASLINSECNSDRSDKDVGSKIAGLENDFRDATDWLNQTGAGLDDPVDVRRYIEKKYPQYYQLAPILSSRPNTQPLYTNESPMINAISVDNENAEENADILVRESSDIIADITSTDDAPVIPPSPESSGTPRLSLSYSDDDGPARKKRLVRRKKMLANYEDTRGAELLKIRREELDIKRTEATSRKQVDDATKNKLETEKQKSMFENLMRRKDLEKAGYSVDRINELLGPLE